MKRLLIILLLFGRFLLHAQTTYYVAASGGDNGNPGTERSPWATLAYAVTQVSATDTIFIQVGTHTINSQVSIPVGVNIKGAGATSIISSGVTTKWQATLLLHSSSEGTNGNQSISYIKMDGNSATAWGAIQINARGNVLIHHCTFVDFFSCGVIFNAYTQYGDGNPPTTYATGNKYYNNTSDNCSDYPTSDDGQGHVMFGGQDGIEIYDNVMTQITRATRRNGYLIKFYSYGYSKGFKIYNNTLTRSTEAPSGPTGGVYWDFCIETWHTQGGAEIYNNTMTGGIDVGGGITMICLIKGDYDYGIWIHDNTIGYDALVSQSTGIYLERNTDGAIIERNLFKNLYNGIMVSPAIGETTENHDIRYNIFNGIGYYGIRFINGTMGAYADAINIYNNVFNAGATSLIGIGLLSVGTTTNLNVANNIIVGFDYAPMYANGKNGQTMDYLTIQNNIFYENGNSNNPMFDSMIPKNYTNSGNIINDPLFFSPTNFHLMSGSPGENAGIKIVDVLLVEDFLLDLDGIEVDDPPNIGCFETIADLASPSYVSSVIEDNDPALLIISYDMPLAQIIPDKSSFEVTSNSQILPITSIAIIGGKVHITLDSPAAYGDLITLSYNIPNTGPSLQSVFNVNAAAIINSIVTNNVKSEGPGSLTSLTVFINPNPVKDSFTINIEGDVPETATIFRISGSNGSVVFEKPFVTEMLSSIISVNLNPGLYIAQILSDDLILCTSKLIVIK